MLFEQAANLLKNTDVSNAADIATQKLGGSNEDRGIFSDVMSSVMGGGNQAQEAAGEQDINFAAKAHDMIYGQNQKSSSAQDLGSAAALQAFKMFAGGDEKKGGGSTEQLAGLAMSEGMKLFMNNNSGAGQSDILKTAVQWALKFFMTQKMGNSSPGFSTLMSIAGNMGGGGNAPAQSASSGSGSGVKAIFGKIMSAVGGK